MSPQTGIRRRVFLAILLCGFSLYPDSSGRAAQAPDGVQFFRYNLAAGDHLEYDETVARETTGRAVHSATNAQFTSHILVLGEESVRAPLVIGQSPKIFSIGFQRNRRTADLTLYTEQGKDRLARERPAFDKRMAARPVAWSEANEMTVTGDAQKPWRAVRESASRLLLGVHEIEQLPVGPMAPGARWSGNSILGLEFSYERQETVAGEPCAVVGGKNKTVEVRYWFCMRSGYIRKLDYESRYETFAGNVHEQVTFELRSIAHNQRLADWLQDPSVCDAALEGLIASPWLAVDDAALSAALRANSAQTQALVLAVFFRRHHAVPPAELQRLAAGTDPSVARLVRRIRDQTGGSAAAEPAPQRGTTVQFIRDGKFGSSPYLLYVPLEYRGDQPFPMLVYLSGGAGIAMDAANSAEAAISEQPFLVAFPHAAGQMWWENESPALVDAVVNDVTASLNVDRQHIYIAGFSNGGTGAVYLASLSPKRYAGVVSLMGGADCMDQLQPLRYKNLAGVPVLLVHGDADPIIPADCSRRLYEHLRGVSSKELLELKILKSRAHDITVGADDGLTFQFLNSHLDAAPN